MMILPPKAETARTRLRQAEKRERKMEAERLFLAGMEREEIALKMKISSRSVQVYLQELCRDGRIQTTTHRMDQAARRKWIAGNLHMTMVEMSEAAKVSIPTIYDDILALEKAGKIERPAHLKHSMHQYCAKKYGKRSNRLLSDQDMADYARAKRARDLFKSVMDVTASCS